MNNHRYADELDHLTRKIFDRIGSITRYSGRIPAIELDLAMEEIRRLYDLCLLIRSLETPLLPDNLTSEVHEIIREGSSVEVSTPIESEPEPVHTESVQPEPESVQPEPEPVQPEPEPVQPEPEPAQPEPEPVQPEPVIPVPPDVKHPSAQPAETTAAPKFTGAKEKESPRGDGKKILGETLKKGESKSINDLIAARFSDQSIAGRMQHNSISNLKTAIGINEKFIFVYELFLGNMALYNEVIEQLNTMPGRNEAVALMEQLRADYHWDIENMAFQKLIDMVTRRYS